MKSYRKELRLTPRPAALTMFFASVCYIIGVLKDVRSKIGKQPGDRVHVTVREIIEKRGGE